MSQASEYAKRVAGTQRPSQFYGTSPGGGWEVLADVTNCGDWALRLNAGVEPASYEISAKTAADLGRWLLDTFGEP